MSFKEYLKSTLSSFFIIVTFVNLAMFVLGSVFRPTDKFGYEAFLSPIVYGLISLVPVLLMYSKRELTLKQQILREFFKLIAIEAALVLFAFGMDNLLAENTLLVVCFMISVAVIFVLVNVVEWLLDLRTAKQLNLNLKDFQSKHL